MNSTTLPNNTPLWHMLTGYGLDWLQETAPPSTLATDTSVVFRLGHEHFRIPAHQLYAIHPLGSYTPIPLIHSCIIGKVIVEDQPVGVLDIRPLIGHPRTPPHPHALLLLIQVKNIPLGLLADAVISQPEPSSVS